MKNHELGNLGQIHLKTVVVEPWAGGEIGGVIRDMARLSARLECDVESEFNGVPIRFPYRETIEAVYKAWDKKLGGSKR